MDLQIQLITSLKAFTSAHHLVVYFTWQESKMDSMSPTEMRTLLNSCSKPSRSFTDQAKEIDGHLKHGLNVMLRLGVKFGYQIYYGNPQIDNTGQ